MIASQIAFLSLAFAPIDGAHDAPALPSAALTVEAPAAANAGIITGGAAAQSGVPAGPSASSAAPTSGTPAPANADQTLAAMTAPVPTQASVPAASPPIAANSAPDIAGPDIAAPPAPRDPYEHFNRINYAISQPIDRFVLRPAAMVYKKVVPHILRDGMRNFLANLFTPVIFVNDVLQLRPKRTLHTTVRFLLNSTLGIGGVFDVAKRHPFGIQAHANGFADTLGYYGVPAGPYLYLPVAGPASPRDAAGYFADWFTQPRLLGHILNPDPDKPFIRSKLVLGQSGVVTLVVGGLDQRAQSDDALKALKAQSVDPYAALRSSYLQSREGEIASLKAPDGTAPANAALDDPLRDPAETAPPGPRMGVPGPR